MSNTLSGCDGQLTLARNRRGNVIASDPDNIAAALAALGITPCLSRGMLLIGRARRPLAGFPLDLHGRDEAKRFRREIGQLRLAINARFGFLTAPRTLEDVAEFLAREGDFG